MRYNKNSVSSAQVYICTIMSNKTSIASGDEVGERGGVGQRAQIGKVVRPQDIGEYTAFISFLLLADCLHE